MPPTVFTDQSGATPGTALDASHLNGLVSADLTEAATNDTLGGSSTFWNNLNRLRYQLGIVVGNAGASWNAAVQMIPLAQKSAASGVVGLNSNSLPLLRNGGTPTVTVGAAAGTGASASLNSGSTDACGVITVNVGTGPAAGIYATLTFSTTLAAAPKVVLVTYYGPNTGNPITIDNLGTASVQIKTTALSASTTYQVQYLVIA